MKISQGTTHELPADLRKELVSSAAALEKWEDITELARNEWICWVISNKKSETRENHIQRTRAELIEGKRRPCCWAGAGIGKTNFMKKIGEGWQYTTYDLGNGRVSKKFHSVFKLYWVILSDVYPFKYDPIWEVPGFVIASKRKAIASFEILRRSNIPHAWIGNPKFLSGLDYEQDKAHPLHDVFAKSNTAQIKSIIDQFVILNKQLLEKGVIDKSFNITKNYGLDKNGSLILIDIGELFDNPERIKKQLVDRSWDKNYVAGCIKDSEAREYFIKKMDENFSIKS